MSDFYITRRAFLDLKGIYDYTIQQWGENKSNEYISNLYNDFEKIANNIELGELRKNRSEPFLMYPSGKHYVVYEAYKDGIIIITVLHQVRNIENIIQEFGSVFYREIQELKLKLE